MLTGALLIAYAAWPTIIRKISQKPKVKKEKKVEPILPAEPKEEDTPPHGSNQSETSPENL